MATTHSLEPLPVAISLNGRWRLAFDERAAWFTGPEQVDWASVEAAATTEIDVPSCWEMLRPDYDGVAWYVRAFTLPADNTEHRHLRLRFGAANYLAHVWVNRKYTGLHEGGYTPFEVDITEQARQGTNEVVVRVLNPDRDRFIDGIRAGGADRLMKLIEIPIGKQIRYDHNFGGLWQDVEVLITARQFLADGYIRPFLGPNRIVASLTICGTRGHRPAGDLRITISENTSGKVVHERSVSLQDAVSGSSIPLPESYATVELTKTIELPDALLWSLEAPNLHVLTAELRDASGVVCDRRTYTFGIREFTIRSGRFHLNGRPLTVMGAYSQGFYPIGLGAPTDEAMLRREIELAREAGLHMLRMHIKTPHPRLLDYADEMGVLIYEEPPLGWMVETDAMSRHCLREVREMVLRDRNHPSVVIWGMINENGWDVHKIVEELSDEARRWDDSRIVIQNSGRGTPIFLPYVAEPLVGFPESHAYRRSPVDDDVWNEMSRAEGFVTEAGYGGLFNVVEVLRRYEQAGADPMLLDHRQYREALEIFERAFEQYRLDEVFEGVEDLFLATQEIEASGTRLQTEARRLSPAFVGVINPYIGNSWEHFGMLDIWREPKQVYHALRQACAPLALIAWPGRAAVYGDQGWSVRVWLVNESGRSIKGKVQWMLEDAKGRESSPLFRGQFALEAPEGILSLATIELPISDGQALEEGTYVLRLRLSSAAGEVLAANECPLLLLHQANNRPIGAPFALAECAEWQSDLRDIGLSGAGAAAVDGAGVVVYDTGGGQLPVLADALRRAKAGATVVALVASQARHEPEAIVDEFHSEAVETFLGLRLQNTEGHFIGYYHYVRPHPIFEGLPSRCFMGQVYRDMCARQSLIGDLPAGTTCVAGAFTSTWGRFTFEHGADLAVVPCGAGRLILTTLPLWGRVGRDPIADRIICNLIRFAADGDPLKRDAP